MQADPNLLPAAGTDSPRECAETQHALPARAIDAPQVESRGNLAESPQTLQSVMQASTEDDAGFGALRPAAQAMLVAHKPLRLFVEQAWIALAPVAGILGIGFASDSARRADSDSALRAGDVSARRAGDAEATHALAE